MSTLSRYRVEVFQSRHNREWYWHAKARNGRVVAFSGEGYKRKASLLRSLQRLVLGAYSAEIVIVRKP